MERISHRIGRSALIALMVIVKSVVPIPIYAQLATGTITGHITDSSGAVVSGATVELLKADVNSTVKVIANGEGIYNFPLLQPGAYSITVDKPGFNKTKTRIVLTVAQTAVVDLLLKVGSNSTMISVEAGSGAQLQTQNSSLDFLVGSKEISDLPLNGRNPYGLAALSPGIMPEAGFGSGLSSVRQAAVAQDNANFETNGGTGAYNAILLDGVPIVVCCQGQPALTPSVENVDQFRVLTSVPPAQFGGTSGGVINIVTKSGANAIRGDIYEYFRNDKLDAATFFAKRAGAPPIPGRNDYRLPHRFNQFGGTVGGPIVFPHVYDGRDKTFFFFGFEGVQAVTTSYITTTVPTLLERQGIFTEAPSPLYDPTHIYPDPNNPGQYIRHLLPAANGYSAGRYIPVIDPVAKSYLSFYPVPTTSGVSNNYSYGSGEFDSDRQYTGRIDHNFSPSQHMFARFTYDTSTDNVPDIFGKTAGANSNHQVIQAAVFTLDYVWALSSNAVLNFQYGFPLQKNTGYPGNYFNYDPKAYGFSSNFAGQQQVAGLPYVAVSGLTAIGVTSNTLLNHYMHTIGASAILQRGSHTLTLGIDGRLLLENEGSYTNPVGSFSFGSTFNNGPNPNATIAANQGPFDSFASFLEGYPSAAQITAQRTVALSQYYGAIYAQDDWKLTPKFVLNLGLRYEVQTGYKERNNQWADFDTQGSSPLAEQTGLPIVGTAQFLGIAGNPDRTWRTAYGNVAPRVGFNYNARTNTVVRGGYGILYLPTTNMFYRASSIGFQQNNAYIATLDGYTPAGTISNPFPNGILRPQGPAGGAQSGLGTALNAIVYNKRVAYQQQWSFGIEQAMTPAVVFSLNYVGSHGVRLPISASPNDLMPKYFGSVGDQQQVAYLKTQVPNPFFAVANNGALNTSTIQRIQLLAAYPQYYSGTAATTVSSTGVIESAATAGNATYNALQASVVAKYENKLTFSATYTWSKLLGNTNDIIGGVNGSQQFFSYQDYYLPRYEHSVLVADAPHRFTGAVLYNLPFGRGMLLGGAASTWLNQLIGGWQLNSIIAVQSGFALPLSETGQAALSGSRPSFVSGFNPVTQGNIHQRLGGSGASQGYFNLKAFRLTQSFELGNVPRAANNLRSPIGFQDDLSLLKNFPIRDNLRVQFRLEAFNVLNKVQFGFPGTQFGSPTFGVISSAGNLPRNIQVALKLFW